MTLLETVHLISDAIDKTDFTAVIFVDLSKACDNVNHNIFFDKLENYGIKGSAHLWFNNYLQKRQQYISCYKHKSELLLITCKVPQGSILGPLLFFIYINDLILCSTLLKFILFADDTNVIYSGKNIVTVFDTLSIGLAKLSNWFKVNKLSLNVKKTNYI